MHLTNIIKNELMWVTCVGTISSICYAITANVRNVKMCACVGFKVFTLLGGLHLYRQFQPFSHQYKFPSSNLQ